MQALADAIMLEIAKLLPERYRGVYAEDQFDQGELDSFIEYLD